MAVTLPPPSEEQKAIIDCIIDGNHVITEAVAGAGKTTCVLGLAAACAPGKRILQITYNSQLKAEVRERAKKAGFGKVVEVHSFHSLCVRYYDKDAHTDEKIRAIVDLGASPCVPLPHFDIVVIDETQDVTMLYFRVVAKVLEDMGEPHPTILILGDRFQGIYQFKDADTRFLTLAQHIWHPFRFEMRTLQRSYRVTDQIAWFVNDVMVGRPLICTDKKGTPVIYIRENPFNVHHTILYELDAIGAKPQDIFVLVPSVKSQNAPFRKLENALVRKGIPCFVPSSDSSGLDEKVIDGKVIFTTFHQAKGRERPVTIVYGFDADYFTFFGKGLSPSECPSTLYVAATRASQHLILVENGLSNKKPLPFLKKTHVQLMQSPHVKFIGIPYESVGNDQATLVADSCSVFPEMKSTSVGALVRFLDEESLAFLNPAVQCLFREVAPGDRIVNIPSTVDCERTTEDVAELNGLAIPAMFEASLMVGKKSSLEMFLDNLQDGVVMQHQFLRNAIVSVTRPPRTPADFLYLANVYVAVRDKLYFKLAQIDRYDWVTEGMANGCIDNLKRRLDTTSLEFEKDISYSFVSPKYGEVCLRGRLDAVSNECVWEFKCVAALQLEHFLQVVVYAWMWKNASGMVGVTGESQRSFRIMNVRNGSVWELDTSSYLLGEVVDVLLKNKYGKDNLCGDKEFVANCLAVRSASCSSSSASSDDGCV